MEKKRKRETKDSQFFEENPLKKEITIWKNISKKLLTRFHPLHQLSDQFDLLSKIIEYLDSEEQESFIKLSPKFEKVFLNFQILCEKNFPKFMKNLFSSRNQNKMIDPIYQKNALKNWKGIYEIFFNGNINEICPICSSSDFEIFQEE
jgi:hypothetical protein